MTFCRALRSAPEAAPVSSPDMRRLAARLIETTGLHYYADKDEVLAHRIARRARALDCAVTDYVRRVLDPAQAAEFSRLIDEITIGESYFFRYPEQFDAMRRVIIPDCLARREESRTLKIWSAGCASGAEPYSIAILLAQEFGARLRGYDVSILATDINHNALEQAREGRFSEWDLRTTPEAVKRLCFTASGRSHLLDQVYRDAVRFEHQNLVSDMEGFSAANEGAFDLILCRNVLIYFAPDLVRYMLRGFRRCLAPGGWLLVGHAEPYFEIASVLTPVAVAGLTMYRRDDQAPSAASVEAVPSDTPSFAVVERVAVTDEAPDRAILLPSIDAAPAQQSPAAEPEPAALLSVIRGQTEAGDWDSATATCRHALTLHPLDPELHYTYALLCEHKKDMAAAETMLRRVLYLDRRHALAHFDLGRCQAARGEGRMAGRSFENALKLLANRADAEPLALSDGLTVGGLRELVRYHAKLLEG